MSPEQIMTAIVEQENRFDDQMERAHVHRKGGACYAPSIYDQAVKFAAESASILVELRGRLAIMEGPGV